MDGDAGGLHHHRLLVGDLVVDVGKAPGGVDETVPPARAGVRQVIGGGLPVVEAEVVLPRLAVGAALPDALGVAAGHIGPDGHPVPHLKIRYLVPHLGDDAHVLVAQIGPLGPGDGLKGGVGAGGGLEKTDVRAAQAAGDVFHPHPVPGGQRRVGETGLELHRVEAAVEHALAVFGGEFGGQDPGDVLLKIDGFHVFLPLGCCRRAGACPLHRLCLLWQKARRIARKTGGGRGRRSPPAGHPAVCLR